MPATPSQLAQNRLWTKNGLRASEKAIVQVVVNHMFGQTRSCFLKAATIASEAGLGLGTVRRFLQKKKAAAADFVTWENRYRDGLYAGFDFTLAADREECTQNDHTGVIRMSRRSTHGDQERVLTVSTESPDLNHDPESREIPHHRQEITPETASKSTMKPGDDGLETAGSSKFEARLAELYLEVSGRSLRPYGADLDAVRSLIQRKVPIERVEVALLLVETRRRSDSNSAPAMSLNYYLTGLEELEGQEIPAGYARHLRGSLATLPVRGRGPAHERRTKRNPGAALEDVAI